MSRRRTLAIGAIASLTTLLSIPVQGLNEPNAVQSYRVDLSHYFATPDAERAGREQLLSEVAKFGARHPRNHAASALETYIHEAERLRIELERHEGYLHLKASLDTNDFDARSADDELLTQLAQLSAMLETTLQQLPRNEVAKAVAQSASLNRYAFLIERAQRNGEHTLPAAEQLILDRLSKPTLSALFDLYVQTVRSTPFARIDTPQGKRDVRSERQALGADPDRSIRQHAYQELLQGYASRAPIYAGILLEIVRERDRIARLKHFDDAPSAVYFSSFQTPATVKACLASVQRHAEINKAYQTLRAGHIGAMAGIADARSWDLTAPLKGFVAPRFSVDEVRVIASDALTPLGSDYLGVFRALLDPLTKRADIAPAAANRYSGGFSVAVPSVESALYVGDYRGSVRDARVIVHEGGHAVHGQLMTHDVASPFYTDGPSWLGEAFAILNELLLYDRLYRTSTDPQARAHYLELLIDDITFQIFTSAMEGSLEQSLYEGVAADRIHSAADLDALTLATIARYEIWSAQEPERAHLWMSKQLLFEDPLYLVNYLYAGLFATKMYTMVRADPVDFQRRHIPLLKEGFHASPETLLRKFFGRDMSQEQLITDDVALLETKIAELRAIYRTLEQS